MVVKSLKRKEIALPLILGILLSILYFILPFKYTLLAMIGLIGLVLVLYDIEIGIMGGVFIASVAPFNYQLLALLYMYFLLAVYLYNQLIKKNYTLEKTKISMPIIIYFIIMIVSTFTSMNFMGSVRDLAIHMGGLCFLLVMYSTVDSKDSFNKIMTTIVFSATLLALHGLYQYIIGVDVDPAWVDVESSPDIRTRVYSVFMNPNVFAEYLVMVIPISVGLFWYNKKPFKKVLFLGTTGIMVLSLLLTQSRGGWLGFAFSALVFILLVDRRLLLLAVPVAVGGIFFLPSSILNRIMSIFNLADSSNDYRFRMWNIAIQMIKDNFAVGVGLGHQPFKDIFGTHSRTLNTYHAHNSFLQIFAELGIVGIATFIFLLFMVFKYGVLKLTKTEDKYFRYVGAGVMAGLAGVFMHGFFETVLYIPKIILMFWIMVTFIITLAKISDKERREKVLE